VCVCDRVGAPLCLNESVCACVYVYACVCARVCGIA